MAVKVQFSLRMIFVVTAVVALIAAEAVAFPKWLAEMLGIVVTLLLPSAFLAQIVYARRHGRAFGIGALSAWLVVFRFIQNEGGFDGVEGVSFSTGWCLMVAGGGVAVMVRWLNRA